MTDNLPRRQLLQTAGAIGLGAATAGAIGGTASATPDRAAGKATARRRGRGRLTIRKEPFGVTPDGEQVDVYAFSNGHVSVAMITWGAAIQRLDVPDRRGRTRNISLGFDNLDDYREKSPNFGATIGRYANRIALGRFTLDGTTYQIPVNNGPNALHGGPIGFDKRVWDAEELQTDDAVGVVFSYVSADGEMGFPGELTTTATYTLDRNDDLRVEFEATTDKPTIVNLTNHTYFNLSGEGSSSVDDHELRLNAKAYIPTDATAIPTGEIAPVAGTPFDFTRSTRIGARLRDDHEQLILGRGYDHCFVLGEGDRSGMRFAAKVSDPDSGRTLTVHTTEPGVQLYTANFLDGSLLGLSGHTYRQGDAFCLETQHYPDSPNQPGFPSTVLRPGDTFRSTTVFGLATH